MRKKWVYGTIFVLLICFIWGNSMIGRELSDAISRFFAAALDGELGGEATDEGNLFIRKAAHFTEYAVLGAVTLLFFGTLMTDSYRKYATAALVGVLTPLVDETIQIFSGRGPALADVWLDIAGFLAGCFVFAGVCCLMNKYPRNGKRS